MSNPNKFNSEQPGNDSLDRIEAKLEAQYADELVENALFEDDMSTKDKMSVVESFRDYRDSRPDENSPYEFPEFHDTHDQFLKEGTLDDLAKAAREAIEGGLESSVAEEIMSTIEDRMLAEDKYDVLNPDYGIEGDRNHPNYQAYAQAKREFTQEYSTYLEIIYSEEGVEELADNSTDTSGEVSSESVADVEPAEIAVAEGDAEVEQSAAEEEKTLEVSESLISDIAKELDSYDIEKKLGSLDDGSEEESSGVDNSAEKQPESKEDVVDDIASVIGENESLKELENELDDSESQDDGELPAEDEESEPDASQDEEGDSSEDKPVRREIRREARRKYKQRRKEIKDTYKATRFSSAQDRRAARAKMIHDLSELRNDTDYELAGKVSKVYTFYDEKMTGLGSIRNLRYDRREELKESKQKLIIRENELAGKRRSYSPGEYAALIDEARIDKDKRDKAIKGKYSIAAYADRRKQSSAEGEQDSEVES